MLSDTVQQKVKNLKMLSVNKVNEHQDSVYLTMLEKAKVNYTFSPFSSKENLNAACSQALLALKSGKDYNEIIKYVKQL